MGNAHPDASEAATAQNHSAFRPQKVFGSCKTDYQQYNSGESGLKKEIPAVSFSGFLGCSVAKIRELTRNLERRYETAYRLPSPHPIHHGEG